MKSFGVRYCCFIITDAHRLQKLGLVLLLGRELGAEANSSFQKPVSNVMRDGCQWSGCSFPFQSQLRCRLIIADCFFILIQIESHEKQAHLR